MQIDFESNLYTLLTRDGTLLKFLQMTVVDRAAVVARYIAEGALDEEAKVIANNNQFPLDWFLEAMPLLKNHLDNNASYDGHMYETYGPEVDFVAQAAQGKSVEHDGSTYEKLHVYTITDDGDVTCITPDMHFVNRMGYLLSTEALADDIVFAEEFESDEDDEDDTDLVKY